MGNAHWAPQSAFWTEGVCVVPNTTLLKWFEVGSVLNRTEAHDGDPPIPMGAVVSLYRADMKLLYGR
jgi:hypothetical protein